MRLMTALALLCLLAIPAAAQQGQPSPMEQALTARLQGEITANLRCEAAVVTLQQQVVALVKERDELKAKIKEPAKK